jgi:hypothetical protein
MDLLQQGIFIGWHHLIGHIQDLMLHIVKEIFTKDENSCMKT